MPNIEQNNVANENIDTQVNPDIALAALERKEEAILTEAQEYWEGELKCTQLVHRNEQEACTFISDLFPELETLTLVS